MMEALREFGQAQPLRYAVFLFSKIFKVRFYQIVHSCLRAHPVPKIYSNSFLKV
jgi:hypothetical protein